MSDKFVTILNFFKFVVILRLFWFILCFLVIWFDGYARLFREIIIRLLWVKLL